MIYIFENEEHRINICDYELNSDGIVIKKYTKKEILEIVKKEHGNNYKLVSKYNDLI